MCVSVRRTQVTCMRAGIIRLNLNSGLEGRWPPLTIVGQSRTNRYEFCSGTPSGAEQRCEKLPKARLRQVWSSSCTASLLEVKDQ